MALGRRHRGAWLLHLLNYNRTKPVSRISVSLRLPAGLRLREVTIDTPDGAGPERLAAHTQNGVISFQVPRLAVYDLILLRMEGQAVGSGQWAVGSGQ